MRYTVAILFALVVVCPTLAASPDKARPNIIFILTDDQAAWALGASGHPDAKTPALDRLARQGVRLTNCFTVTPVCSASRAAIVTGRYPSEVGITDYLDAKRQPHLGLDPAVPTWPRLLSEHGYATALIGKWHVGPDDEHHPTRCGYDYFAGFRVGGMTSVDPTVEIDGKDRVIKGWTPDILTDLAIDYVKTHRDGPFAMSLHFWAPHANIVQRTPDGDRTWLPLSDADWSPFESITPALPEPDYPKLDTPRAQRMTREYLASVASVDRNVNRLLQSLDAMKLADNTIVIFTADHGFNLGHHGIWHKGNGRWLLTDNRGPRPNLWDYSLRVPCIIRWPGMIKPGATADRTVTFLDWYRTLAAAAGIDVPADSPVRGRNALPVLLGRPVKQWNDTFYTQYRMWDWNQTGADLHAIRTPQWKLVRDLKHDGLEELYHLAADPDEKFNLIHSPDPSVRSALRRLDAELARRLDEVSIVPPKPLAHE